ncbi:MAG: Gfo/Idh/MocA family oxidoreductase [Epulopiscium sp.]|nr:Gfo/Idh/MocA family oxidoreductase [Candidatus Epulonipiscium sp.]
MLRIGIVGLGGMGIVHYKNYLHIDGCEVVAAVCNSERSRKKAKEFNLTPYDDVRSMVTNENIDVIDICTPTYLHKKYVIESLNLGKHVIVEKPIALHKEDAQEMFELADRKDLLLFVGHVVQFTKETEILRDAVISQKYGKALDGYFKRLTARPQWTKDGWLFDKNKSGVLPFDLHIHDLDLIISLFGTPKDYNFSSCGRMELDYKEAYRFNYEFENLNVTAEAAWYNADYPFTATWRIYFERAVLEYDGVDLILYQPNKEPFYYDLKEEVVISTGINLPPTGMFYNQLSHFISCINQGIPSDIVCGRQVIKDIEILEDILKRE